MQSTDQAKNLVSIVDLKDAARRMLPPSSTLRDLVLSEPDYLSHEEIVIKVRMYSRLLYRELGPSRQ